MTIKFWRGKLLFRNGKLAMGPACCCGQTPAGPVCQRLWNGTNPPTPPFNAFKLTVQGYSFSYNGIYELRFVQNDDVNECRWRACIPSSDTSLYVEFVYDNGLIHLFVGDSEGGIAYDWELNPATYEDAIGPTIIPEGLPNPPPGTGTATLEAAGYTTPAWNASIDCEEE